MPVLFSGIRPSRALLAAVGLTAASLAAGPASAHADAAHHRPTACRATQLFVAPNGDDRASGSKTHPWRTVDHARQAIETRHLNSPARMHCDIDVELRAGTYPVSSTIAFTAADSGANGHQVVYRSYDGPGRARLVGAKQVNGWQPATGLSGPAAGHVYRAQVGTDADIRTLFEGHTRATTARFPNRGTDETWAPYLRAATNSADNGSQTRLTFNAADWNPTWDMHDAQVVVWSGGSWSWFTDTDPVKSVDWTKNVATLSYPTRYSIDTSQPGSRYYLQNSLDFLDTPGEYYWDSQTGWLYYWPRSGSIDAAPVYAPTVKTIVSVTGDSTTAPAHDLTFDGLAFEYSNFVNWYRFAYNTAGESGEAHKYEDYDRQIELPRNRFGALTLVNTRDVALHAVRVTNTGWEAAYFTGLTVGDSVTDSYFAHLGGDGVKIEGPYPGEGDIAHNNTIDDNYFNYYGELVPGDASAVELLDSGDNVVSHAVIEHSARYAVSIRAVTTATNADDYAQGNALSYLRIAHMGEDSGDTGTIYAYGIQNFAPHTDNSSVNQVLIDDVNADPSMVDAPPRGVHMDFGGCGFTFSNISVTNVQGDQYHGPSTECNDFDNDSWMDGFDASKLDTAHIGLTDQFPYDYKE